MTITVPYNFISREYQDDFFDAMNRGAKRAILIWHRRAGKDVCAWNYTIQSAVEKRGIYYYIFPEFSQGRKVLWDGMTNDGTRFLDYLPPGVVVNKNNQEMKIRFSNGSIIQIVGSDNYDALMGTNPSGCIFSEYSLQNPNAWLYVRPILDANDGWAIFVYTPRGANHAKELYDMAKNNNNWFVQRLTVDDTGILSKQQIQYMQEKENISEDIIQQEWYCSFSQGIQGAYYAKYLDEARKDKRIGVVPYDDNSLVHTAWDLGVSDSTVIIWFQTIGKEIHVIDYHEGSGEGLAHYAKIIKDKPYIYGQHFAPHDIKARELSSGISRVEFAASLGIRFTILNSLKQSKADAIENVRARFRRCWIDSRKCERLISALENYRKEWNDRLQMYNDRPLHDWSSHGCFIGETLIRTDKGNVRIDEIKTGDLVETPNGYKKVLKTFQYESKYLRNIKTTTSSLVCTPKHHIFSEKGLIESDALVYNDVLYHVRDKDTCQKKYGLSLEKHHIGFRDSFLSVKMKNKSYLTDIGSGGMDFTTDEHQLHQTLIPVYKEPFIPITKEISLNDGMYIMSMETPKTMIFRIWKLFLHQITQKCISLKKNAKNLVNRFIKLWNLQKNGTLVRKEEIGIDCMQKKQDLEKKTLSQDFPCRVHIARKIFLEKFRFKSTALKFAQLSRDICRELTMKLENVLFAVKSILPIDFQLKELVVKSVELKVQSAQKVYDLEIENDHCYYANDILVSNSDAFSYLCLAVKDTVDEGGKLIDDNEAERMYDKYRPF